MSTPGECLRRDSQRLRDALKLDVSEARLEVRILLGHALGVGRAWLIAHEHDEIPLVAQAVYGKILEKRLSGEPIAYILGEREFFGRSYKVTPDVLIPRPETELLVELALSKLAASRSLRILDLGTGSGCIAITLALARPDCEVVATDQSEAALAVARENGERLGAKVRFCQGSWYEGLPENAGRFDVVVSNPPYIARDDIHLAGLSHEPQTALNAGSDGLDDIRVIVAGARDYLNTRGWLMFEHGWDQGEACRELLAKAGLIDVGTEKDLAGHGRVSFGRLEG